MSVNDTSQSHTQDNTVNSRSGITLENIEIKLPGEEAKPKSF
jgi:hypothetical protein